MLMKAIETTFIVVGATLAGARFFTKSTPKTIERTIPAKHQCENCNEEKEYEVTQEIKTYENIPSIKGAILGFTLSNLLIYAGPLKEAIKAREGMKIMAVTASSAIAIMSFFFVGVGILQGNEALRDRISYLSAKFHEKSPDAASMLVAAGCAVSGLAFGNFIAAAVSR